MSKRAATDFYNKHTLESNIEDGDKGSGPVSGPVSSVTPKAPSATSSMTVAALKAQLDANFIKYKSKTKKAALATLLLETMEARSQIPRLNEDVQGYIVSFLSGFDSLHVATQLARGFRLKAKLRLDAMLKRSDADIKIAAKAWSEDAEAAREIYGPISIWNTSGVMEMADLFSADDEDVGPAAERFNEDISKWDVSNVTTMEGMFYDASAFNGDLSSWDVSNVTTMEQMFAGAKVFNGDLTSWDVSNVTTMEAMFCEAEAFNGDLSSWNVSNVTTMEAMFCRASAFNSDLSSWNVSNVTTMEQMFAGAKVFNGDLSLWNVSNVTTMWRMFRNALAFNRETIKNWDLSGKETSNMFNPSH
ncbi:hypothetical protein TrST_g5951 [Triparma strigata]|uniref:BspA family leucine-rich repeat surface protein n=1 Tax=Triparma strigata TaxID=1606541 RepID=A0A9W7EV27_9STRA|nr:hypothetical protein TrST_g5951 [Triparma strigata]